MSSGYKANVELIGSRTAEDRHRIERSQNVEVQRHPTLNARRLCSRHHQHPHPHKEILMKYSIPQGIDHRPIAVIGAGTLGRRIALMMSTQGGEVRIFDKMQK